MSRYLSIIYVIFEYRIGILYTRNFFISNGVPYIILLIGELTINIYYSVYNSLKNQRFKSYFLFIIPMTLS